MADEPGVLVGVHALFEGHSVVGGDGVWGAVAPVPFVVGGFQGDGDVVSEQVDDVSLGRVGFVVASVTAFLISNPLVIKWGLMGAGYAYSLSAGVLFGVLGVMIIIFFHVPSDQFI